MENIKKSKRFSERELQMPTEPLFLHIANWQFPLGWILYFENYGQLDSVLLDKNDRTNKN